MSYIIMTHHLNKACYRISIALAFSCGRAKTIRIRYVWMGIFLKTEKKKSVFKNIRIRMDNNRHHRAFKNTPEHSGQPINK